MQSRRDCKSDTRFDRLVAILFNDVDEYEKQVLHRSCNHHQLFHLFKSAAQKGFEL